jgi:hypothetical protein
VKRLTVTLGYALLFFYSTTSLALDWDFGNAIEVTRTHGNGIFHHLESSGRRNIAVSDNTVAIVWEDNRDGAPRIYLAHKKLVDNSFAQEIKISGHGEAFEPSITALSGNRFLVAWEEDSKLFARIVSPNGMGKVFPLGNTASGQVSLTGNQDFQLAVYSQRQARFGRIMLQQLTTDKLQPKKTSALCPVDKAPVKDEQLYPTVVISNNHIIIAWEDRRPGHTIIMAARSNIDTPCDFTKPQRISEYQDMRNRVFGKGHGVARVALASNSEGRVLAAWADKRDFREGYDIFAAEYTPASDHLFGENEKVQDDFGGVAQQWHPAVTSNQSGAFLAGWDDNRNGNADIMLSWRVRGTWSDDLPLPHASGPFEQTHPSIVVDSTGRLHVVWVERKKVGGMTTLRYMQGIPK